MARYFAAQEESGMKRQYVLGGALIALAAVAALGWWQRPVAKPVEAVLTQDSRDGSGLEERTTSPPRPVLGTAPSQPRSPRWQSLLPGSIR